ncbi:hemerythrin domain-containing protein [Caenimonas terrae]|uniref:Hemerythrin domain-containing protein n=1 Tax=Caenimonas terrae TaxID=696074 RepID=A0ABW0NHI2_9BURK
MNAHSVPPADGQLDTPLDGFSRCHLGILSQLTATAELPQLLAAAERARHIAADTVELFDSSVPRHHADEENDLFPAVQRSAALGAECAQVAEMIRRLTAEHRAIEALWALVRPALKMAAHGAPAELDEEALERLGRTYLAHAREEEQHFLPLAQRILGRDSRHLAALGIALHMRHVPQPLGYI